MEHLIPHVKGPMSTHPTNSSDVVRMRVSFNDSNENQLQ